MPGLAQGLTLCPADCSLWSSSWQWWGLPSGSVGERVCHRLSTLCRVWPLSWLPHFFFLLLLNHVYHLLSTFYAKMSAWIIFYIMLSMCDWLMLVVMFFFNVQNQQISKLCFLWWNISNIAIFINYVFFLWTQGNISQSGVGLFQWGALSTFQRRLNISAF